MEPAIRKFLITTAIIGFSTCIGIFCRRKGLAGDRMAETLMTFVAVFGYPAVGFLSIWVTRLGVSDLALPFAAAVHCSVMTFGSLALSGIVARDDAERGMLAVAGGVGNNGFTMGAFILYLLAGEEGMGLSGVYGLVFAPVMVFLMYPIARHYSGRQTRVPLVRLMIRSLCDWRSVGLPVTIAAILLSAAGVKRPAFLTEFRIVDILTYTSLPLAFFAIGLRLRLSRVAPLWRHIIWLGCMRFLGGAFIGVSLAMLTRLSPWGFYGTRWTVFVVQAFVPTSVTGVAVANMFGLKPEEASVLFVANTFMYLALVLPLVFILF